MQFQRFRLLVLIAFLSLTLGRLNTRALRSTPAM